MKRTKLKMLLVLAIMLILSIIMTKQVKAEDLVTITFKDEKMYNAMVEALGDKVSEKGNNQIKMTQANIDAVKELKLTKKEISDVSGIENFKNLEALDLGENNITDIESIGKLENLKGLYIQSNKVKDIKPISNLKKIENLSICNNPLNNDYKNVLSEMSKNGNFENLAGIWLWELGISDISEFSFLKDLKKLSSIDFHGNQISDISYLKEFPNLTYLYIFYNQISDISAL